MASNVISRDLITVIAQEMSCAVERSVEYGWHSWTRS